MNTTFNIGDVVVLKSGSQSMTVTHLYTSIDDSSVYTGFVDCRWFYEGEFKTATFHQDTLEPAY